MTIKTEKNKIIYEDDCFDLSDTLECGQVFRYEKTASGYDIISGNKFCRAEICGRTTTFITDDTDYFIHYFALSEDYKTLNEKIIESAPELTEAVIAGRGIRLLRQDPLEMIISFIISANNNIPRIKGIISRICRAAGDKHDWGYAFPTRGQLCGLSESDLINLGAGYRAAYIYSAARSVDSDFMSQLTSADTMSAMKLLLSVKGVGKKVADCILLFGLGRGDTFPVDTWMEQALLSEMLNTNAKIRDYYIGKLGNLAGLAQQYIYHYQRNIEGKS